ncbi:MAG: glycosyltransferase family 4 protein [Cyanobacteria bacterium P01_E01_bin.43]
MKYAPGLYKEFQLLGRNFQRHGIHVTYVLAQPYSTHFDEEASAHHHLVTSGKGGWHFVLEMALFFVIFWRLARLARGHQGISTYLFYNPHPVQPFVQILLRLFLRARIVTVLHEPNKTAADLKKYGVKGFVYFAIAMGIQSLSVGVSAMVVTMSPHGANLFVQKYPTRRGDLIAANLLLPPHAGTMDRNRAADRRYFSFVGTVNRGKNIDDIIAAVNAIVAGRLDPVLFLIITASDIDADLAQLAPGWGAHLRVINKPQISDGEIADVMAQSRAILILHKTASQSGVLPMAYSHGTPVIARDLVAFTQYMDPGGIVLAQDFTPADLVAACAAIGADQRAHGAGATQQFEAHFSDTNFDTFYAPLLAVLASRDEGVP